MTDKSPALLKRARRKAKLKMRFKDRLNEEIAATVEKLELLKEIQVDGSA
jgi:hypothetical protein